VVVLLAVDVAKLVCLAVLVVDARLVVVVVVVAVAEEVVEAVSVVVVGDVAVIVVVVDGEVEYSRTLLLPSSATQRLPLWSKATPLGSYCSAAVGSPTTM